MTVVPRSELVSRLASFQQTLYEEGVDAALILQHADLYYFSGAVNRAYLYIPATGSPLLLVLPGAERIRQESEFPRIVDLAKTELLPDILARLEYPFPDVLGLEADVLPAAVHEKMVRLLSPKRTVDVSGLIRRARMVKSPWEISRIQAACRMGMEIFNLVPQILCQRMSELELAAEIESFARKLGHPGYMRVRGFNQELTHTLVLSGPDSAIPSFSSGPLGGRGLAPEYPHGATYRQIGKNEPVLVDFSASVGGYMADMTRTYCIGNLPGHMEHAYDTCLAIQDLLRKEAKAGAACGELWTAVRQLVRTQGLCEHFMGMARRVAFIGHGVGIEIDELPVLAARNEMVLTPDMVVAIEPKFVFPDGAVGLENTFVVGEAGLIPLVEEQDAVYYIHEH